jgi:hypothetical protein
MKFKELVVEQIKPGLRIHKHIWATVTGLRYIKGSIEEIPVLHIRYDYRFEGRNIEYNIGMSPYFNDWDVLIGPDKMPVYIPELLIDLIW